MNVSDDETLTVQATLDLMKEHGWRSTLPTSSPEVHIMASSEGAQTIILVGKPNLRLSGEVLRRIQATVSSDE